MLPITIRFLLALSVLAKLALAVPNVTVVPATGDCADFPSNGWTTELIDSDNSQINLFGVIGSVIRGATGIESGYMAVNNRPDASRNLFRCIPATATSPITFEAYVPSGVSGTSWNQVNISYLPYDAVVAWGIASEYTIPLEPYYHFIDGVKQDGVYFGNGGVTTWGVKFEDEGCVTPEGATFSCYDLRLLGPDSALPWNGSALWPGEVKTFYKLQTSND